MHTLYGGPAVVVDFGTFHDFDVVSAKGEFLGGALAPGVEISLDALAARGARLFKVELARPRNVIGKSTVEALQSGILYGFAGQVDGIVRRIVAELGGSATVLVTAISLVPAFSEDGRLTTHPRTLPLAIVGGCRGRWGVAHGVGPTGPMTSWTMTIGPS